MAQNIDEFGANIASDNSETIHNIEQNATPSLDKIEEIKNDIRESIEKGIPSDEQEKDILNNKFENLVSAMETFRDSLNTEKGKEEFENSKEYAEEAGLIIQDIKNNDGTKDNEIKEKILNLLDKTIPQTIDKVNAIENNALVEKENNNDSNDGEKENNADIVKDFDISQYESLGTAFQQILGRINTDDAVKDRVFNLVTDAIKDNFDGELKDEYIDALSMAVCEIHDESQLEKINNVRAAIIDEKRTMVNITKDHRFERNEDILRFERSIDKIRFKIDDLSKSLTSNLAKVSYQDLKWDSISKSEALKEKLNDLKLMSSDDQIKEFKKDIYKFFDSIDKGIDKIKSSETVVLKEKDIEKTGDATVDRWNAKVKNYERANGIDHYNSDKDSTDSNDPLSFLDNESNSGNGKNARKYQDNPVYVFRTLVRDIYANSRGVEIDGQKVTADKIIGDLGEMLRMGIPGAVLVGVIGLICVFVDKITHIGEDRVEKTESDNKYDPAGFEGIKEKIVEILKEVITEKDSVGKDDIESNSSNDEKQKDDVDKNEEEKKQSQDTEKSEENIKQVDNDKSDVDKETIDNKSEEDKKSQDTTNSDEQENKIDNDEKSVDKKDSKGTDKSEDDKSKIENADKSNVDNKSSDKSDDSKKEQSIDKKEEKIEKNIEYDKDWKDKIQSIIEEYDYKKIPYSSVKKEIDECRKAIPDVDRRTNTLAMAAKDAFASHTNKWPSKSHNSRMENVNNLIIGSANGSSSNSSASSSLLSRFNNVIQAIIDVGKAKISAIGAFFKSHSSVFAKVGVTVAIGVGTILIMPSDTKAADVEARIEKEQVISTVETKSETSLESEKIEVNGLTIDLSDAKTDDKTIQEEQELVVENAENKTEDTEKTEDDKDKIETLKDENKNIESSKEDIKEKNIESKVEEKQEEQKNQADKVEGDLNTDSKVDQDEKDTDPMDNQELEEENNQDIETDEAEEKIESDTNDMENKEEAVVEVDESEQESVDQEDSNEETIEQEQDDTEIQDEDKDVEESEEKADQTETNEEEPESVEAREIEDQNEPEDLESEGKIEQDKSEEDPSKEDDAVAVMGDDDENEKKKDSGTIEDNSSDSQEGEDTQDESDSDSVDIDGHSEEVNPDEEKVDAKEAATGDDKSEEEEQTGIERDEEEKENVESSENNAEQNNTIENLSDGLQDASLDATNEEAVNKTEDVSTDNEGNIETTTADPTEEHKTDIPEEQSISFVDSVLSNFETNGENINDIIVNEILDRGGSVVDFSDNIDELKNQGYDINIDYIADTIYETSIEFVEPNVSFGFGDDGTIYNVGNSDSGITPQDISVDTYDSNINDIDLESMIDSTASDFATYTEDTIEAIISDITLPDVKNPELNVDNDSNTVDNGLELNQLEKVNASDNLDNAADNASKDFDPSDNNQNNNIEIPNREQYQNNLSESDIDIDSIFKE